MPCPIVKSATTGKPVRSFKDKQSVDRAMFTLNTTRRGKGLPLMMGYLCECGKYHMRPEENRRAISYAT